MLKGDLRACVPDRLPGVANGNFSLNVLCWYAVALLLLLLFFFQFLPQQFFQKNKISQQDEQAFIGGELNTEGCVFRIRSLITALFYTEDVF